jgi:cyclopropane fatty-acyl-phospholipid synthase-like methyltransferase
MIKPFAESSEQNKEPILAVIQEQFAECRSILEIGSGTGQHAVYFAEQLPHLRWQPSDAPENLPGIQLWLDEANRDNLDALLELDVSASTWPQGPYDGVFSANTVHIMSWWNVQAMFTGIGRILQDGGRFCLYGPFKYGGVHTSESNARFDVYLRQRDPNSGVRDVVDLQQLAKAAGLSLIEDIEMPVNNRTLVWQKG